MNSNLEKKLRVLLDVSKLKLQRIFQLIPVIDFIIDETLFRPLEKVCTATWLRSNNVKKIYKFDKKVSIKYENTPVYFIRSTFDQFKNVIKQIKQNSKTAHIIIFPEIPSYFDLHIESNGLYGQIILHEFQWLPIYYDFGTVCLEYENLFKNVFILNDCSHLTALSKCFWELSLLFGDPDRVFCIGSLSQIVFDQYEVINKKRRAEIKPNPEFSTWVLIDRSVDYFTPMLTPSTYLGLIMEFFEFKSGIVKIRNQTKEFDDKLNPQQKLESIMKSKIYLDATKDSIYTEIKNKTLTNVSQYLNDKVKELKVKRQQKSNLESLSSMKESINKIQELTHNEKVIRSHLQLCEMIFNQLKFDFDQIQLVEKSMLNNKNRSNNLQLIEEILITENNFCKTLKSFCLFTLTQNLTYDEYHEFKTKFIHEFGYKFMFVFDYLESAKLLICPQKGANKLSLLLTKQFQNFSKKLKLIPSINQTDFSKCPSYVFNGAYIPFVCQLISNIFNDSDDEFLTKFDSLEIPAKRINFSTKMPVNQILVCIIGGITAAEIAGLQLLENIYQIRIVNLATNLISWKILIDEIINLS